MKKAILLLSIILLSGCAVLDSAPEKTSPAAARKAAIKQCVHDFLGEDVPPKSSIDICQSIYKRWED